MNAQLINRYTRVSNSHHVSEADMFDPAMRPANELATIALACSLVPILLTGLAVCHALAGAEHTVVACEATLAVGDHVATLAQALRVADELAAFFVAGGLWISSGSGQADSSNSSDHYC